MQLCSYPLPANHPQTNVDLRNREESNNHNSITQLESCTHNNTIPLSIQHKYCLSLILKLMTKKSYSKLREEKQS